jgi:hypothetical protein
MKPLEENYLHRDLRYLSSFQLALLKPFTPDLVFPNASILNTLIHLLTDCYTTSKSQN